MGNLRLGSRVFLIWSLTAGLVLAGCQPLGPETALLESISSALTVPVPTVGSPLTPTPTTLPSPQFVVVLDGGPLYDSPPALRLKLGPPRVIRSAYPGQGFEVLGSFRGRTGKLWYQVEKDERPKRIIVLWIEAARTQLTSELPTPPTPYTPYTPYTPQFVVVPDWGPLYNSPPDPGLAAGSPSVARSAYPGQRFEVLEHYRDMTGTLWYQVEMARGPGWIINLWIEATRTILSPALSMPPTPPAPQFVVVPAGGLLYDTPGSGPAAEPPSGAVSAYPGQRFEVLNHYLDETGTDWFQVEVDEDPMQAIFLWIEAARTLDSQHRYGDHIPTVKGHVQGQLHNWAAAGGKYRLQRTGTTVTARISARTIPGQSSGARSAVLFTVPSGWRPAQAITWAVESGSPTGREGPEDPTASPVILSLHISPGGTVSYQTAGGQEGAAAVHFTTAFTWPLAGAEPHVCARPPRMQQALQGALQEVTGKVLSCEEMTWSQLAQIRSLAVAVGHPEQLAGLTGLQHARLHFGSGVGFPEILAQIPQVRNLHLVMPDVTALSPDLLAGVPQVRQLTLSTAQLRALPKGFLDHMPYLESLILDGAALPMMGGGADGRLGGISKLALLPQDLLVPVPQLTHLEITSARLKQLPPDFLVSSTRLQSLFLHASHLAKLPPNFLQGTPRLTALKLRSAAELPVLPDLLVPVPRLHTLELLTRARVPLPPDFLASVPRLRNLRLWHGLETPLPASLLAPVPDLRTLELLPSWAIAHHLSLLFHPFQSAAELPPVSFWEPLADLSSLILWPGSSLPSLPADFLVPLPRLTSLTLRTDNNKYHSSHMRSIPLYLPAEMWEHAPQLREVFLMGEFRPEDRPTSHRTLYVSQRLGHEDLQTQAEAVTHLTLMGSYSSQYVPENLLAYFPRLTHLALPPGLLVALPRDFLAHAAELTQLVLQDYNLSHLRAAGLPLPYPRQQPPAQAALPQDILAQVPSLAHLTLQADRLAALPSDLLAHTPNLTQLSLQADRLAALPSDLLAHTPNLTQFSLQAHSLAALPSDLLAHTPNLTQPSLQAHSLAVLPSDLLAHTPNLAQLSLQAHSLAALPSDLLAHTPNLTQFSLQADRLTALPETFLVHAPSLTQVTLQAEKLQALPPHFLAHLDSLTRLSLQGNSLAILPDDFLQEVPNLTRLVLQVYGLESLPPGFLAQLAAVPELELQFSQGQEVIRRPTPPQQQSVPFG